MTNPLMGVSQSANGAEATRREYLNREANIRGIALLMLLNGVIGIVIGVFWTGVAILQLVGVLEPAPIEGAIVLLVSGGLFSGLSVWLLQGSRRLKALEKSGRPAGYVWAALSLLGFPLGTLIGIAGIVFLSGEKAGYVLSPEYREIVAKTPEIKASWSLVTRILIWLLVLVLCLVLAALTATLLSDVLK